MILACRVHLYDIISFSPIENPILGPFTVMDIFNSMNDGFLLLWLKSWKDGEEKLAYCPNTELVTLLWREHPLENM